MTQTQMFEENLVVKGKRDRREDSAGDEVLPTAKRLDRTPNTSNAAEGGVGSPKSGKRCSNRSSAGGSSGFWWLGGRWNYKIGALKGT